MHIFILTVIKDLTGTIQIISVTERKHIPNKTPFVFHGNTTLFQRKLTFESYRRGDPSYPSFYIASLNAKLTILKEKIEKEPFAEVVLYLEKTGFFFLLFLIVYIIVTRLF